MNIPKLSLNSFELECGVGYLKQDSVGETYPLHYHDFYELFFVLEGKAIHNVNCGSQLLSKGSFVFIRPDDVHKYSYLDNFDMRIINCGIASDTFSEACNYLKIKPEEFHKTSLPPHVTLEGPEYWEIKKKLEGITDFDKPERLRQYFRAIFSELLYIFLNSESRHNTMLVPVWLSTLIDKMELPENFISGIPAMLSIAQISHEHLTRMFRKFFNTTPTKFINVKRIIFASELLLERKHEIIDICYMSGFNSLEYFYRIFKEYYKCTPKQFLNDYVKEVKQ